MRTPEEIKRSVKRCFAYRDQPGIPCDGCPYESEYYFCKEKMAMDIIECIDKLEARIRLMAYKAMMHLWISVKDRMPDEDHICLVIRDDGRYDFAMYRGHDVWDVNGVCATDITHWMPLPEQPEED